MTAAPGLPVVSDPLVPSSIIEGLPVEETRTLACVPRYPRTAPLTGIVIQQVLEPNPENMDVLLDPSGVLYLGGSIIGMIRHLPQYPSWRLDILDSVELGAVGEAFTTQAQALTRARHLLYGLVVLHQKPGKVRRGWRR
jgi:hypothetical protein